MFAINQELLDKARAILFERRSLYWITGGACSGKSTICQFISEKKGIPVFDMDAHIYDSWLGAYRLERHPACSAYFSAANPLAWALSLSWEEFNALNMATDAEYLDLLSDDLGSLPDSQSLLVDGGFSHPALLAQVVPPWRIYCLEATEEMSVNAWENSETRTEMKGWVHELPDPETMWRKFLDFDRWMSQTIRKECKENSIETFMRNERTPVEGLAIRISQYFGL